MKIFLLYFTMAFLCALTPVLGQRKIAQKGFMIISKDDLERPVALNGEWQFFMSDFKPPADFRNSSLDSATLEYIDFPSTWNHLSKARNPGEGFATFRLLVVTEGPGKFAISLPDIYTSYSLWINGKLTTGNGTIGMSAENTRPQWRPHTVYLDQETDSLDIVLQVANFSHANGGIREPIYLGSHADMKLKRQISTISVITLSVSLAILALLFLLLYSFATTRDSSAIYFMALALTWSVRALFSNEYLFNFYFPNFPWVICVRIEYITLYVMMIWAILFIGSVFKNDVKFTFKVLFVISNSMFTLLTLFFKPSIFTQFLPIYLSFAGLLMIYIVYVLIRAVVHERTSIWLMVSSIFLGVIVFSYNIISYEIQTPFNPVIINSGYLAMFVTTSFVLLRNLGYLKTSAKSSSYLTYDELYKGN